MTMANLPATDFPEHEKLKTVQVKSQAIGAFLEWLRVEEGVILARYDRRLEELVDIRTPAKDLLAEFFDINQQALEAEKAALLDELRAKRAAE